MARKVPTMTTDTVTPAATDTVDLDIDAARKMALAIHLQIAADDIDTDIDVSRYDDTELEYGRQSYRVLTDDEADEAALAAATDSLWAFNVSFLSRYVPALRDARAAKAWSKVAAELCEDAAPLVEALLGDRLDEAMRDAISEDGRGHFLSGYDGEESEQRVDGVTFYIYRTN